MTRTIPAPPCHGYESDGIESQARLAVVLGSRVLGSPRANDDPLSVHLLGAGPGCSAGGVYKCRRAFQKSSKTLYAFLSPRRATEIQNFRNADRLLAILLRHTRAAEELLGLR